MDLSNVGYCTRPRCSCFLAAVIVPAGEAAFTCRLCAGAGSLERARGHVGSGAAPFREVRVLCGFDPATGRYAEVAMVRDDALVGGRKTYTLRAPAVANGQLGLHLAELLLGALHSSPNAISTARELVMTAPERILSMDQPRDEFIASLRALLGGEEVYGGESPLQASRVEERPPAEHGPTARSPSLR